MGKGQVTNPQETPLSLVTSMVTHGSRSWNGSTVMTIISTAINKMVLLN
jgi:hypothetical protein